MTHKLRLELARQLWFWQSRDVEGSEHAKQFAGQTTYSEADWNDLLIESERKCWLERADRVLTLLRGKRSVKHEPLLGLGMGAPIVACSCGWKVPVWAKDADGAYATHVALMKAAP